MARTGEMDSSLLVTVQGRKTPHAMQGHRGVALGNSVNKQGLKESDFIVSRV